MAYKLSQLDSNTQKSIASPNGLVYYQKRLLVTRLPDDPNCLYKLLQIQDDSLILIGGSTIWIVGLSYRDDLVPVEVIADDVKLAFRYEGYYSGVVTVSAGNLEFSLNQHVNSLEMCKVGEELKAIVNGIEYHFTPSSTFTKVSDAIYYFFSKLRVGDDLGRELFNKCTIDLIPKLDPKVSGVTKTLAKIKPFYENTKADFLSQVAFKTLLSGAKSSVSGIKMSVVINKIFESIDTQESFDSKLHELSTALMKNYYYSDYKGYFESVFKTLPEAKELLKESIKRKATGAFSKKLNDLDFVDIDAEKYPLTHAAVYNGEIPQGTFFRKDGETYFIYNDNWELWEPMLQRFPEATKEIAADASRRTTYEKDLMSYFYFIQHALPEYLERHTGRKWTCEPKLVKSSRELEPPKEGENGVAKTRSAFTPIADNDKNHVVVPYVSMIVHGARSQSCYALDYNILQRGMSYQGNVVTNEVEEKLNGADDYGLMFYTLTGTGSATGYPTFLIIFERLDNTTRVHFHRTHPMRSKNNDYSPIHNWILGCYKWMIGNVPFGSIKAQQGDLAFVEYSKELDFTGAELVNSYDSHTFAEPVPFLPYLKQDKQNILGYFLLQQDTELSHPEHKNRIIPAGTYSLRQCKSWEANPVSIWSLRID